jgi:hypothetical protein
MDGSLFVSDDMNNLESLISKFNNMGGSKTQHHRLGISKVREAFC